MINSNSENQWLYKCSVLFIEKLLKEDMINQKEYNTTQKKLAQLYNIATISCNG